MVGAIWVACSSDLSVWARLGASLLAALVHVRLFVIYHDYQHEAILQNSIVAKVIFTAYGLLAMTPPSAWKQTHDHHHLNNSRKFGLNSIGSYPVMTVDQYRTAKTGEKVFYHISRHPLTIALGFLTVFVYGFCVLPVLDGSRRHIDTISAIVLQITLIVVLAIFRPDALLFGLLIPAFVASAMGGYLFYAQHNFPGVKLRPGEEWDHVHAALHSSSFLKTNKLMAWFTGNIGYHHVHHLNARIPFYRLPETMAAFEELQSPGVTTLRPRDVISCFRMKLWDPDAQQFVSFREGKKRARLRETVSV